MVNDAEAMMWVAAAMSSVSERLAGQAAMGRDGSVMSSDAAAVGWDERDVLR